MRQVTCKNCGKSFNEAQKEWDDAYATGTCPFCAKFFDQAVEDTVDLLSQDSAVSYRARRVRSRLVYTGILTLGVALALYLMGWADSLVATLAFIGVPQLIYGLVYSSRQQARVELAGKTNLDQFTKE